MHLALSYYYFLANMVTFGQQFLFKYMVDEDAIHAKIQENKKKPVTKSGFQKKLEDIANQAKQQQNAKKK
jgi:YidC/Oxa1 family membrane protein insertase